MAVTQLAVKTRDSAYCSPMYETFSKSILDRASNESLGPMRVRKRFDCTALEERPEGREPEKLFGLKPDIVIDDKIVVDTKWKELDPNKNNYGVSGADVYQMLAYSRAYRAKRLILLYPWHAGLNEKSGIYKRWLVAGSCIPFDIATVDVGKPKSVRDTLEKIIEIKR